MVKLTDMKVSILKFFEASFISSVLGPNILFIF
jgi:hypothetical protein